MTIQPDAYKATATLMTGLENHTKGVTHTATFFGHKVTFPFKDSALAEKVGNLILSALKFLAPGRVTDHEHVIQHQIANLTALVSENKDTIKYDFTDSPAFFSNIQDINKLISEKFPNLSKASKTLHSNVTTIMEEQGKALGEFTKRVLDRVDKICAEGNKDTAHITLKRAHDVVSESALTISDQKPIHSELNQKYADSAYMLHEKAVPSGETRPINVFNNLFAEYKSPPQNNIDLKQWQEVMAKPLKEAAGKLSAAVQEILKHEPLSEADIEFLKSAQKSMDEMIFYTDEGIRIFNRKTALPEERGVLDALNPKDNGVPLYAKIRDALIISRK